MRRDLTGIVLTASSAHDPPYVDIGEVDPLNLPPGYKVGTRLAETRIINSQDSTQGRDDRKNGITNQIIASLRKFSLICRNFYKAQLTGLNIGKQNI